MATRRVQSFTNRYLDEALERLKLPSDYALAEALGITTQAIYKMRAGGVMSATTAAKIAEILEIEPLQVIADVELERATKPDERELWTRIRSAAAIAGAAIGLALIYGLVMRAGHAGSAFDLTQVCDSLRANAEALAFAFVMPAVNMHCGAIALALAAVLVAGFVVKSVQVRSRTGAALHGC